MSKTMVRWQEIQTVSNEALASPGIEDIIDTQLRHGAKLRSGFVGEFSSLARHEYPLRDLSGEIVRKANGEPIMLTDVIANYEIEVEL